MWKIMKKFLFPSIYILAVFFLSCDEELPEIPSAFDNLEETEYFDAEVFSNNDLKIYGTWRIFNISGGLHGNGYAIDFDYLVMKKIGIYGFLKGDSLLEFGKVSPAAQLFIDPRLFINFEKDEDSDSFFTDREKIVHFSGNDTLELYSPCCDRFNYHFVRER